MVEPPVDVRTRSGEILTIHFDANDGLPSAVYMEGETKIIYQGQLSDEAVDISISHS